MDLLFLALYAALGYLGGTALLAQAGVSFLHAGQVRRAAACFRLGAAVYPGRRNRVLMRSNLLAALCIMGDYEGVHQEWRELEPRLAEAGPYAPLAVACYAATLYYQGRYREGLEVTGRPDALLPEPRRGTFMAQDGDALRLLNRSSCLLALGQLDEAERAVEQACRLQVSHPVVEQHLVLQRARVAFRRGHLEEAGRLASTVETRRIPEIYLEEMELTRAYLLAFARLLPQAESCLDTPIKIPSPRGFLYRPMAEAAVAEMRGQPDEAVAHYRRALQSGHPAGEAGLRAGHLLARAGRLAEAQSLYEAAIRTDPESFWATLAARHLQGRAS
ncbi:MAG TPA: tetratricopeptide repeat protein [Candidatus Nitrosotenuis sp.]|nr:tetratricopeptide repeat protein [Candidatus Nitrosotenuis sp.]